jgi:phosphopentomutase
MDEGTVSNVVSRCILIVLDSVGAGALPDAARFGDEGADTLGHIFQALGPDYSLPNLARLGLYHAVPSLQRLPPAELIGSYGKMASASPAKDTTAGHWELSGLVLEKSFPVYPNGFPGEFIEAFEKSIGTKVIGNRAASGTEIIKLLGEEHCRTGYPIVYTSADSVFQIAAHEGTFGLSRLYDSCRKAREMLVGDHEVCRVIARPFAGEPGRFYRTGNRHDFSLLPPKPTILDAMKNGGGRVVAIGKIEDIFCGRGITEAFHAKDNTDGMHITLDALSRASNGTPSLIFTNLVDFDMLWGHRRDVKAYGNGLTEFDRFIPALFGAMRDDDLLMITADHGCDPTYVKHTDHTREYVPLLVYGKHSNAGVNLGIRPTFADVAQTIADIFDLSPMEKGTSFRKQLIG